MRQIGTKETRGRCCLVRRVSQDARAKSVEPFGVKAPVIQSTAARVAKRGMWAAFPWTFPQTGQGQAEVFLQVTQLP